MKAFIKLHLKENIRKNSFILFGVLGLLITLIIFTVGEFSVNGAALDSHYAQFGFQWTFLNLIASLAAVSLTMGVVAKYRESKSSELLRIHGLKKEKQYASLFLGNLSLTGLMALLLLIGLILSSLLKQVDVSILGFLAAITVYILTIFISCLLSSTLTLFFQPAAAALLGLILVIFGSLRGTLELIVGNLGGAFGNVVGILLKAVPPLDTLAKVQRDLFFGELTSLKGLLHGGIYLWVLCGLVYLLIKWVAKNEK